MAGETEEGLNDKGIPYVVGKATYDFELREGRSSATATGSSNYSSAATT